MKHCEKCDVWTQDEMKTCPLCRENLEKVSGSDDVPDYYIVYPQKENKFSWLLSLLNLLVFCSFVSIGIFCACNAIFHFTPWRPLIAWFVFGVGCLVFVATLIFHTILSKRNIIEKILFQCVLLICLGYVYLWISSNNLIAVNYVIPCVGLLAVLVLNILSLVFHGRGRMILASLITYILFFALALILILVKIASFDILLYALLGSSFLSIIISLINNWALIRQALVRVGHV